MITNNNKIIGLPVACLSAYCVTGSSCLGVGSGVEPGVGFVLLTISASQLFVTFPVILDPAITTLVTFPAIAALNTTVKLVYSCGAKLPA